MRHYWSPPCRTLHSQTTRHTLCDRQYLRATGHLPAQVTLNNHPLKTLRDSIPPLLLKVRMSCSFHVYKI